MIGAPSNEIPKWSPVLAPTAVICHHHHHQQEDSTFISLSPSPNIHLAAFAASLQRYVPRNNNNGDICREDCWSDGDFHDVIDDIVDDGNDDDDDDDDDMPLVDALTCDEFRMYEFKVRQCARSRSHDWMQCPYAHPGEKARRRDPRKYHYCGTPCPEFRKGNCRKGDSCEFAHGVFECWLHPSRYRTQPCKDGVACRRRVCFFAHVPEELRVLPSVGGYDGSPVRKVRSAAAAATAAGGGGVALSPTSNLMGPVSPSGSSGVGSPPASATLEEVMLEMTNLQLRKKAREAGMRWDWRHRQLQRMGYNRTRGFDGWRGDRVPENASTVVESSVDEPAWFSDIVN